MELYHTLLPDTFFSLRFLLLRYNHPPITTSRMDDPQLEVGEFRGHMTPMITLGGQVTTKSPQFGSHAFLKLLHFFSLIFLIKAYKHLISKLIKGHTPQMLSLPERP